MRKIVFIVLAFVLFTACKTPQKTTSKIQQDQETEVKKDIQISDEKLVTEIANQVIDRLTNETTEINLTSTEYDTDKPVNPTTGKPPIKKESDLKISNQKTVDEKVCTEIKKDSVSHATTNDNSILKEKTTVDSKEVIKTGLRTWQKVLMVIGGFSIVVLILFLIIKFKR